jgi:hypothetical protein
MNTAVNHLQGGKSIDDMIIDNSDEMLGRI